MAEPKQSESQMLREQLSTLNELYKVSVEKEDSTRVMSLIRLMGGLAKNIQEAEIREGELVTAKDLADWRDNFMHRLDQMRGKYFDEDLWNVFIDEFLKDGFK